MKYSNVIILCWWLIILLGSKRYSGVNSIVISVQKIKLLPMIEWIVSVLKVWASHQYSKNKQLNNKPTVWNSVWKWSYCET